MINWRIKSYSDYLLRDVDLSLGFTKINNEKYLRFPAWIYYKNFFPSSNAPPKFLVLLYLS